MIPVPTLQAANPADPTDFEVEMFETAIEAYRTQIQGVSNFLGHPVTLPPRTPSKQANLDAEAPAAAATPAQVTIAQRRQKAIRAQWFMLLVAELNSCVAQVNTFPQIPAIAAAATGTHRIKLELPDKYLGQSGETPRIHESSSRHARPTSTCAQRTSPMMMARSGGSLP